MSFEKGIKLSSGFVLNSKAPLDNRTVFESIEERDLLPDINRYEGLICYVKSKKINYQIVDGVWQELKFSLSESSLGNVDKEYVDAELKKKAEKEHEHSYDDLTQKPFIPNRLSEMDNDTGFITIDDIDNSKDHEHQNTDALNSLTLEKMEVWDSKSDFDGDYGSLTNLPVIPTVDVDKAYVDKGLDSKSEKDHKHSYNELTDAPHIPAKTSEIVNDSGFITIDDVDMSQNHIHINMDVLNKISQDEVDKWDNKSDFDGDYNSLSNLPVIPTVDVDKTYVDTCIEKTYVALKTEVDEKSNKDHAHESSTVVYTNDSNPSIKSVKDALDRLLYFDLTINLKTNQSTTVEKGYICKDILFNWTYNKNIVSQSFDGNQLEANVRSFEVANPFADNRTFTLHANDGVKSFSRSVSFAFLNGRYWGTSSSNLYDSSFINGLSKELSSNRGKTFNVNCNKDEYIFYCIPSSFGTPTFTVGGFSGGFSIASRIQHTNIYGHTESYDIWKSVNPSLGNTTVVVS